MKLNDLKQLSHLELELDSSGKSEAYYSRAAIPCLAFEDIQAIKKYITDYSIETLRVCFHRSKMDVVHEMVIFHRRGGFFPPHKHLEKSESYQIIEGSLVVETFDDHGTRIQSIILNSQLNSEGTQSFMICKIPSGLWHWTEPLTDIAIFKETRPGPFSQNDSVIAHWNFDIQRRTL